MLAVCRTIGKRPRRTFNYAGPHLHPGNRGLIAVACLSHGGAVTVDVAIIDRTRPATLNGQQPYRMFDFIVGHLSPRSHRVAECCLRPIIACWARTQHPRAREHQVGGAQLQQFRHFAFALPDHCGGNRFKGDRNSQVQFLA